MDSRKNFLMVEIGSQRCGLTIESVAEVMRPLPVQRLEQAPPSVIGISLIRGQGVPVIDLSKLLQNEPGPVNRFVAVRIGERLCALAVGKVIGIESVASTEWQELPPLFRDLEAAQGLSVLDRDLVLLLQTARLLPLIQSVAAVAT